MSIHSDLRIMQAMHRLGYPGFKSPEQQEMIEAVVAGEDVLSIIPTGGGKTAGAVVPAVVHDWFVIVVSPLIALMGDQRDALKAAGIPAFSVHGKMPDEERLLVRDALLGLSSGPAFLFASPEMILTKRFQDMFRTIDFDLMFIDEVHTVSVWGASFRPKYARINSIWKSLGRPRIVAGSATADPLIVHDIKRLVPFGKRADSAGFREVRADPVRENLYLQVEHAPAGVKQAGQKAWALTRLRDYLGDDRIPTHGPTIIYCTRKREVEMLCRELSDFADACGYRTAIYHGDLEREHRRDTLRVFQTHPKPLIIATSGFGMGIDRADVRTIIHFGPTDLVEYAQQIGRAGRDGLPAYCWTLYLPYVLERAKKAEAEDVPDLEKVEQVYRQLAQAWRKVQAKQRTRFSLNAFHHLYDSWIREQEHVIAPGRHMELRRRSIAILADLGYVTVLEDYVTGVRAMQFGSETHQKLIELTQMQTRRAERSARRIQKFFSAELPNQPLLFEIIAEE